VINGVVAVPPDGGDHPARLPEIRDGRLHLQPPDGDTRLDWGRGDGSGGAPDVHAGLDTPEDHPNPVSAGPSIT